MATNDRRAPLSLDMKKKEMKKKKNNEDNRSMPEKNKMGREIEEIFRANKKKRKESARVAGKSSAIVRVGTGKEDKKVNKKKVVKDDKEKKKNGFPMDNSSENRSNRRRTETGLLSTLQRSFVLGIQMPTTHLFVLLTTPVASEACYKSTPWCHSRYI